MKIRYKIFASACLLGALFLLGRCNRNAGTVPKPSAVLPQNVKEKVSFNEKTHTLTIQTHTPSGATQTIKEYAKNPVVSIQQDNQVVIQTNKLGFENDIFLGAGYSDTGRILLGDNVFHFSRFDLMGAISWTPDSRYTAFKVYTGVSYLAYSNTAVGIGVDPVSLATGKPLLIGFVSIRL